MFSSRIKSCFTLTSKKTNYANQKRIQAYLQKWNTICLKLQIIKIRQRKSQNSCYPRQLSKLLPTNQELKKKKPERGPCDGEVKWSRGFLKLNPEFTAVTVWRNFPASLTHQTKTFLWVFFFGQCVGFVYITHQTFLWVLRIKRKHVHPSLQFCFFGQFALLVCDFCTWRSEFVYIKT